MDVPTGQELRSARTKRNLTQADVAESADISQAMLSRIENDDVDPRLPTLQRIVTAINGVDDGIDVDTLELTLSEAIRQQRKAAKLTQGELAERAEVSQPLIARIEGGDVNPRTSTFRAILSAIPNSTPSGHATTTMTDGQSRDAQPDSVKITDADSSTQEGANDGILESIESSFERLGE